MVTLWVYLSFPLIPWKSPVSSHLPRLKPPPTVLESPKHATRVTPAAPPDPAPQAPASMAEAGRFIPAGEGIFEVGMEEKTWENHRKTIENHGKMEVYPLEIQHSYGKSPFLNV